MIGEKGTRLRWLLGRFLEQIHQISTSAPSFTCSWSVRRPSTRALLLGSLTLGVSDKRDECGTRASGPGGRAARAVLHVLRQRIAHFFHREAFRLEEGAHSIDSHRKGRAAARHRVPRRDNGEDEADQHAAGLYHSAIALRPPLAEFERKRAAKCAVPGKT